MKTTLLLVSLLLIVLLDKQTWAQRHKSGGCSPAANPSHCENSCQSDYQCPGIKKCCPTSCGGTMCSFPVKEHDTQMVKPGDCMNRDQLPWICSNRCSGDGDCFDKYKCCTSKCGGKICVKPIISPACYISRCWIVERGSKTALYNRVRQHVCNPKPTDISSRRIYFVTSSIILYTLPRLLQILHI